MIQRVFISSTSRDLIEYRQVAIDTCLKLGLLPVAMEFFEAMAEDAAGGSTRKLDESDLYVGIFAHRYGYVPDGQTISVTEMEYGYARSKGIPCLVFVIDPEALWPAHLVELGDAAERLKQFKTRVLREAIVNFFQSPADLQAKLSLSLIYKTMLQERNPGTGGLVVEGSEGEQLIIKSGFGSPSTDKTYKGDVFVVSFTDEAREVYRDHIIPVAQELYLEVKHHHDLPTQRINGIWSAIYGARLMIIDCSGQSPYAFHDLGIAQTLGKPVILLANNDDVIPMFMRYLRHIVYEATPAGMEAFRQELRKALIQTVAS
jgi:hypothetical protein